MFVNNLFCGLIKKKRIQWTIIFLNWLKKIIIIIYKTDVSNK